MAASLRGPGTARTLLQRMAADEARADRIRHLKADHPELTWERIAEEVGVKERSAIEWQKTGGISVANAKRLAEVFDVTYEWLWFGDEHRPAPDLMKAVSGRVEHVGLTVDDVRDEFRAYVTQMLENDREILEELRAGRLERGAIQDLLDEQTQLLAELREAVKVLAAAQRVLKALEGATARLPAQLPAGGTVEEAGPAGERRRGDRRHGEQSRTG